jgi:hypothetical protein
LPNDKKQEIYVQAVRTGKQVPKALGLGLISAASALAGGIAVAWWYRKTLTKLQNPIAAQDLELAGQDLERSKFLEESDFSQNTGFDLSE